MDSKNSKWNYTIQDIKSVSDEILKELTDLMNKDCQPGKYSLAEVRDKFAKNMDILYIKDDKTYIHFILIDIFSKHKTVYLHDVCVSMLYRGQGIFKKALQYLSRYYEKKGFHTVTLDASDSTKEEGLDQKARIAIFAKAGFHINPKTDAWSENGDFNVLDTKVLLDSGKVVEIKSFLKDNKYSVKGSGLSTIDASEIKRCYGLNDEYVSCPMILNIGSRNGGNKRKTKKRRA